MCSVKDTFIIKCVALFKSSLLLKNTNITTKLNWKLFTKVIEPSEEAWVCLVREANAAKRKRFNLERIG
jgi:hypothetical protein